ncbi:hypothetical protein [Sphingomonas sp. ACRSK]|uniref:hypothetical protein n=1 Tax=Sphingomonas sp. ACRSK TaxID=2918213 RepID=UPI001EF4FE38|nr:hypothetical protein [Sphingomonas sp. ACRSK]MCG7348217.1 hypothetical protein [Sphingomonas sp. ACRSK]
MAYIDPRWVRAVDLSNASPNSLVTTSDYGKSVWLVSEAPQPVATVINGEHLGLGMMIDVAGNWSGYAVEGVSIEVDDGSAFMMTGVSAKTLSIVRERDELTLLMNLDNGRGRQERTGVVLASGLPSCTGSRRVGYSKWRVVKCDGDRVHVLQEVDANAS